VQLSVLQLLNQLQFILLHLLDSVLFFHSHLMFVQNLGLQFSSGPLPFLSVVFVFLLFLFAFLVFDDLSHRSFLHIILLFLNFDDFFDFRSLFFELISSSSVLLNDVLSFLSYSLLLLTLNLSVYSQTIFFFCSLLPESLFLFPLGCHVPLSVLHNLCCLLFSLLNLFHCLVFFSLQKSYSVSQQFDVFFSLFPC
jgi:hypothetical protein